MKTYLRTSGWGLATLVLLALVVYSCKKDNSNASTGLGANQQRLNVFLADDPGSRFDNVFLDIKSVQVLVDTCDGANGKGKGGSNSGEDWGNDYNRCHWGEDKNDRNDSCKVWDSLAISAGVYDVLSLRNGADTLLSEGVVTAGKVRRIQINLGDNNYLVKDSIQYPLKALNGQVKLVVNIRPEEWEEYQSGHYRLWLDFDVDRSIIQTGNGKFILRPVIHVFLVSETGSISGKVTPYEAYPVLTVYNSTDTAYALPWKNGEWKIRGLNTGTYNVFVNASNGYADTTITGVKIETGKNTAINAIKLSK
ncbi:DUF4382 domain-containing protein [Chitinophaga sancti]|uniref:DUF4382 domain-containing protein n=1 Tax=Chitinophaga sancti TaxID=1004 RepID=UPI003F78BC0A